MDCQSLRLTAVEPRPPRYTWFCTLSSPSMQYSTPVPSNRVSAPFTSESARPAVQNSGHLFEQSASVYPSLQAYETSLTTQKAPANIRNPFSSGQRKANHQHASSSQPLESQPAQAPALTQQTRQQASAPASHSKEQKYAVQVSSQALRLSRARSNFTTLRYNIVYALALYFLSSSRPYRYFCPQSHAAQTPD